MLLLLQLKQTPQEPAWYVDRDEALKWPAAGTIEFKNVGLRYRPELPLSVSVSIDDRIEDYTQARQMPATKSVNEQTTLMRVTSQWHYNDCERLTAKNRLVCLNGVVESV